MTESANVHWNEDNHNYDGCKYDNIFHHSSNCRASQSAGEGECGKNYERDNKGNLSYSYSVDCGELAYHDGKYCLHSVDLKRYIRKFRCYTSESYNDGKCFTVKFVLNHVDSSDIIFSLRNLPQPWHGDHGYTESHTDIGNCKVVDCCLLVKQFGNCNKSVGSVQISTHQKPGKVSTKFPSSKCPFSNITHVTLSES